MAENVVLETVSGSDAMSRDIASEPIALERNVSENCQESGNSQINPAFEDSDVDLSTGNPTGKTKHAQRDKEVGSTPLSAETIEIHSDVDPSTRNPKIGTTHKNQNQEVVSTSLTIEIKEIRYFLKRTNPNKAICFHCGTNNSEDIVQYDTTRFDNISHMKCNRCGKTMEVDSWWMFDEHTDVKEEIFRFLQYHNPTKTLCCNEDCKANDRADIVPAELDRFGIVSSVGCTKCGEEMSLEMNTENSHTLTVIEKAGDLKPGDEIMFRRWYGISHHAIYLRKKESEGNKGCCSSCCKCFRISDDKIDVISHTFDVEDARVKQTEEWLGGIDMYRVEYDSCYPPKWTEWNAKRAAQFVTECKDEAEKQGLKFKEVLDSNYDPLMENCEHFARRCKTGQSESRQVRAFLYNCGTNIAMLALRVAILATWWISEAVIEDIDISGIPMMTTLKVVHEESQQVNKMEVILATSLCILFLTLKVVLSSIQECRKIRYQEPSKNKQNHDTKKKTEICRYGKSCSECCCKCCPKQCYGFRYLCRMLCCLVPFRLCKEICCTACCERNGCSYERKQCCDDPIMKFCCTQYVVIILRVVVSEGIVMVIPIVFFASFELYCKFYAITYNSMARAGYGFLFTLPLVLVLSFMHSCITNCLGRAFGCCFNRFCCCCFCCCRFRNPGN